MKRFLPILCLLLWASISNSQIVLNEIQDKKNIELINLGTEEVDVRDYWIYNEGISLRVGTFLPICPYQRFTLRPGERFFVNEQMERATEDGEIALFSSDNFQDTTALLSYVQWGSSGHEKEGMAVAADKWVAGEFVALMLPDGSLEYDGEGISASDWTIQGVPSICEENGTGCDLPNFPPEFANTDPATYCLGGGLQDLSRGGGGFVGAYYGFVLLDSDSTIIAYSAEGEFDLDSSLVDTGYAFFISYDNTLLGLESGQKIQDIIGCYVLSEEPFPVHFVQLDGGTITTDSGLQDTSLCVETSPLILSFTTTSTDTAYAYVVTDTLDKTILFGEAGAASLDLSDLGTGTYRVYGYSYTQSLLSAVGLNVNNIFREEGECYLLSANYSTVSISGDSLVCAVSATEEYFLPSQVIIYPNPSSGAYFVKLAKNLKYESYTLYNNLGVPIRSGTEKELHFEDIPNGIYWVKLQVEGKPVIRRIVKS